jgi:hypothetical protein
VVGLVWLTPPSPVANGAVEVTALSGDPHHVFEPGAPFEVTLEARTASEEAPRSALSVQWVDFRGRPLADPHPLPLGQSTTIPSPSSSMPIGYYGLRLLPDDGSVEFNPHSGYRPELGFAVLPRDDDRRVDIDGRFGIVHHDYRDPYVNPGWIKTATDVQIGWTGSGMRDAGWDARLQRNRELGQVELPLINGQTWRTGSIEEIRTMMAGIFRADPRFDDTPSLPAYELGLEENLRRGSFAERLELTAEKFKGVKEERAEVDPSVALAYQIAGTSLRPYRRLLESSLGPEIDILSAHPYPWNDWPTPDEWHDVFVADLRSVMAENEIDVPIWYTEVGSSQNDSYVPVMYSGRRPIGDGQTRSEYAAYLVKIYASALANGIEKVFWYNYKDRDSSTTDAEDHFGLRDHWDHPKPGYVAYATMLRCMKGREAQRLDAGQGRRAYRFAGADRDCFVAWLERDAASRVQLRSLWAGLDGTAALQAFDLVGTPIEIEGGELTLTTYPTFFHVERTGTDPSGAGEGR